ncbi:cytochrome c [Pseudolabrys sp. FHR47]|uniref:cytochrome c n=1 Tax=Pseudolabrys sp. FHR47 TaxID=2562284 RepID=UPI0010BEAFD7|nr:cytochrome c [Pseudolabrys sp. FHR47]
MTRLLLAFLPLFAVLAIIDLAVAADAAIGEVLARRWCAACHIVAADQQSGNTQAPPFSAIARKPNFDAAQLALFLMVPHPVMPSMTLSRSEAADLAAYIAAQK